MNFTYSVYFITVITVHIIVVILNGSTTSRCNEVFCVHISFQTENPVTLVSWRTSVEFPTVNSLKCFKLTDLTYTSTNRLPGD